ncbi:acyl carrier protein [Streptomyces sp. NPDC006372]|uniref:acyl carrier protein n=1 Tax=Streptomyces sp. NPDC006372 TaxID=3155599 RepID=UPI0033A56103
MSAARRVLGECVAFAAAVDAIGDDDDLRESGLNSGEMVLFVMRVEELLGRPLTDSELDSVTTIASVDALLNPQPAQ